jgi:hypothetical protein
MDDSERKGIIVQLEEYQVLLKVDKESGVYSQGLYNGIELAIALMEERRAFYIGKNGEHSAKDMKDYPEYFL